MAEQGGGLWLPVAAVEMLALYLCAHQGRDLAATLTATFLLRLMMMQDCTAADAKKPLLVPSQGSTDADDHYHELK